MTPSPLVQTFPYVAWILLAALAAGSFVFAAATRQWTDAAPGYVRFTAFCSALLALLVLGVEGGLMPPQQLAIRQSPPDLAAVRSGALVAFVALATAYAALVRRPRASMWLGVGGLGAGFLALGAAAAGWAPAAADAVPLLVQLAILSVVTGGSLASIVLGHWYLVTPRISERPLILQARMLLAAIGLQALLFVTWTTLGGGPGQDAFEAFSGGNALLVVLRGVVTLAFPLVLTYMAWRTAQTRSMESATGLLYINLAAVMAGTIGAAALYVASGILV